MLIVFLAPIAHCLYYRNTADTDTVLWTTSRLGYTVLTCVWFSEAAKIKVYQDTVSSSHDYARLLVVCVLSSYPFYLFI